MSVDRVHYLNVFPLVCVSWVAPGWLGTHFDGLNARDYNNRSSRGGCQVFAKILWNFPSQSMDMAREIMFRKKMNIVARKQTAVMAYHNKPWS